MKKLTLAAALLCPLAAFAAGKTAYVTDKLEAQLRTGPSTQNKIVKLLGSGIPVTVLEEDSATGYTHVTTDSGAEGWILSRHLTGEPPARSQLEAVAQKAETLSLENKQLKAEVENLKRQLGETNAAKEDAAIEAQRASNELTLIRQASANTIQLLEERNQLQEKSVALENELEHLRREKETLAEKDSQDWFLKGAGVLFGGLLLGLLLPRLGSKRRSRWDTF